MKPKTAKRKNTAAPVVARSTPVKTGPILQVETWPVARVKPYFRNPRKISKRAVERVAASLKEFGWRQPIVVDREGVIVVGHTRRQAAVLNGWSEVPVHVAKDLSDEQARAYRLADNRTGEEALWDDQLLSLELSDLKMRDVDLDVLSFDAGQLDMLLGDLKLNDVPRPNTRWLFQAEQMLVADLKPHPRNYKTHPEDQIDHIARSLKEHGFYRNIIVANDNTIIAGHGVVEAAKRLKMKSVPVVRLDLDPNSVDAMKVLAGDNEINHLGMTDDRAFTEILKEIKESDTLFGTGYDDMMLANLLFVTRPASEIQNIDEAAQWVGMPEYEAGQRLHKLIITFETASIRDDFVKQAEPIGLRVAKKEATSWQTRWPYQERDDLKSVRFEKPKAAVG